MKAFFNKLIKIACFVRRCLWLRLLSWSAALLCSFWEKPQKILERKKRLKNLKFSEKSKTTFSQVIDCINQSWLHRKNNVLQSTRFACKIMHLTCIMHNPSEDKISLLFTHRLMSLWIFLSMPSFFSSQISQKNEEEFFEETQRNAKKWIDGCIQRKKSE